MDIINFAFATLVSISLVFINCYKAGYENKNQGVSAQELADELYRRAYDGDGDPDEGRVCESLYNNLKKVAAEAGFSFKAKLEVEFEKYLEIKRQVHQQTVFEDLRNIWELYPDIYSVITTCADNPKDVETSYEGDYWDVSWYESGASAGIYVYMDGHVERYNFEADME